MHKPKLTENRIKKLAGAGMWKLVLGKHDLQISALSRAVKLCQALLMDLCIFFA